jgi:hypothetical protein
MQFDRDFSPFGDFSLKAKKTMYEKLSPGRMTGPYGTHLNHEFGGTEHTTETKIKTK